MNLMTSLINGVKSVKAFPMQQEDVTEDMTPYKYF